ncbi:hypothetical protein LguiA_014326 [Lonicera macranthoides]
MWALRRASISIKNRALNRQTFQACGSRAEIASFCIEDDAESVDHLQVASDRSLSLKRFYSTRCDSPKSFMGRHRFSSQAGTKSSGEEDDDLEDGFSELEAPASSEVTQNSTGEAENDDELISEPDLSGEEENDDDVEEPQNEMELSDTETGASEKISRQRKDSLALFKNIMAAPGLSVHDVMDRWVEEGNEVTRPEIAQVMLNLRKRRMYGRALQLSEWLETSKKLEFVERDYASRLDLIAKVRGLQKAENYIDSIPKSFRGEVIYRTLLANCVVAVNVKKAEEVFNKMKDLEFTVTAFTCNQLLLLYKRTDKKKIADVLLLMEKEDIKPSLFTYRILIDVKGQSNDMDGMEQILETMKAEGIEPDLQIQAVIARHYASGGLNEKAEAVLKEMEGGDLKANRWACRSLLPLYAALGNADEVGRIWKFCEQNPRLEECMAAIEAYGKLKKIEEAEAVFDKMCKTWKKLSSKHYSTLLKVYANQKMLAKGKDLVKKMSDSGCRIGPLTWDALVKLYVEAGEVEKADSILMKASQNSQMKPMFSSYMAIMDQYARRGDVHNAEKMLNRMRQIGYVARIRQFQSLVQAYIIAKRPAYGIRERMKADNVFPNKALANQLPLVDAFRKTAVSDLLD